MDAMGKSRDVFIGDSWYQGLRYSGNHLSSLKPEPFLEDLVPCAFLGVQSTSVAFAVSLTECSYV